MTKQVFYNDLAFVPPFHIEPARKGKHLDLVHTRERPPCRRMEQLPRPVDAAIGVWQNLPQLIPCTQLVERGGQCRIFEDDVCDGCDGR